MESPSSARTRPASSGRDALVRADGRGLLYDATIVVVATYSAPLAAPDLFSITTGERPSTGLDEADCCMAAFITYDTHDTRPSEPRELARHFALLPAGETPGHPRIPPEARCVDESSDRSEFQRSPEPENSGLRAFEDCGSVNRTAPKGAVRQLRGLCAARLTRISGCRPGAMAKDASNRETGPTTKRPAHCRPRSKMVSGPIVGSISCNACTTRAHANYRA